MMRPIDLLPPAYAERRRQRRNLGIVVVIGLIVLGLLFVWWFMLGTQIAARRNELTSIEQRNASLQAEIDELQRFAALEQEVIAKEQALNSVMQGDLAWPSILTEIAMVIPGEIWFENLTGSAGITEGATPVGTETAAIRVADQETVGRILFRGNSLTMPGVSKWLIRLAGVRGFNAVWLNTATEADLGGVEVVGFENTIELGPRALSRRFSGGSP
jgi:Tfp pilus assembly protein PilN